MIARLDTQPVAHPVLRLAVGGNAVSLGQTLLEAFKLVGREGGSFARKNENVEQDREAAVLIEREPYADGGAITPK